MTNLLQPGEEDDLVVFLMSLHDSQGNRRIVPYVREYNLYNSVNTGNRRSRGVPLAAVVCLSLMSASLKAD